MTENPASPDSDQSTGDGPADVSPEAAALEADIERTRADLAQTVDQLAAKLNLKSRVRTRVAGAKDDAIRQLRTLRAHTTDDQGKPAAATISIGGGVIATAAVVLAVALWRRNHPPRRTRRRH